MADYDDVVRKAIWKYGRNADEREDFEQECWLAILVKADLIRGIKEDNRNQYVYVLCKNRLLEILEGEKPEISIESTEGESELEKHPVIMDIDSKIYLDEIFHYLEKLDEPYRSILQRRYGVTGDPETCLQIAESYGRTHSWVIKKEAKGLKMLKELIDGPDRHS